MDDPRIAMLHSIAETLVPRVRVSTVPSSRHCCARDTQSQTHRRRTTARPAAVPMKLGSRGPCSRWPIRPLQHCARASRMDGRYDDPPPPYAHAADRATVSADIVVIGSGAGGGVVASRFARAGKTEKPTVRRVAISWASLRLIWRRSTLEGPCGPTTIDAGGLNCRVRYGNGWDPTAMTARNLIPMRCRAGARGRSQRKAAQRRTFMYRYYEDDPSGACAPEMIASLKSFRAISTGQLQRLLAFHPRPINVVVYHDPSPLRD